MSTLSGDEDRPEGQAGVLAPVPGAARFVIWTLSAGADPRGVLGRLAELPLPEQVVVGLGAPPAAGGPASPADLPLFPATQGALWARFSAPEPGRRFDEAAAFAAGLGPALVVTEEVEAFMYRGG